MSQMHPDPAQLQAMMAQLSGPQGGDPNQPPPGGGPDTPDPANGNWLVDAINAVHEGMVQEGDSEIVSALGAILNNLTTVQAKKSASPKGNSA